MKININSVSFILFIIIGFSYGSSEENPEENLSPEETKSGCSEMISKFFYSPFINDTIKLDISLPLNYLTDADKKYKVIFLTDGYWRKEDYDTIHKMSNSNEIPEAIVVGIGYPDNHNFNQIRIRDLIINAYNFLCSIKYEVIPFIESNFRADSSFRTLWGSSYGGYFLIYAFTEHQDAGELFTNYICASPALYPPYTHIDLLENEERLYSKTMEIPVNLYVTVGENETESFIDSYNRITDRISSRNYKDLVFEYEIIPNTDHYSVWKPTLIKGLKKFLKG